MNQKLLGAEIEPPGAGGERDLARQILELVRRRLNQITEEPRR